MNRTRVDTAGPYQPGSRGLCEKPQTFCVSCATQAVGRPEHRAEVPAQLGVLTMGKVTYVIAAAALAAIASGLVTLPAASAAEAAPNAASLPRPASDGSSTSGAKAPNSDATVPGATGSAAQRLAGPAGVKFAERRRARSSSAGSVSTLAWTVHGNWGVNVPNANQTGLIATQSVLPTALPSTAVISSTRRRRCRRGVRAWRS